MKRYRKSQTFDTALLEFHERFNSNEGFSEEDLRKATEVIDACFEKMNDRLKSSEWLAGDNFSLADIAWIPQLVILKVAKYPFEKYPHLEKWKNEVMSRQSFKQGVLAWLPEKTA